MNDPKKSLKREIGLIGLSANIINIIIGAGIFVLPAIVAADLGAASILAYIFCGVLITLIMLCFAEVGSKITATGGVYTYIERSFGHYAGFLTAILFLFSNITGTAAVANAIINIISQIFQIHENPFIKVLFFLFLFGGLAYINILGLKKGVGLVKMITLIKLSPLLLLVLIGFKDVSLVNLQWETAPSLQQIGTTSLILFFAFSGAGSALSVNGEVKNPQKTIPRAILLSTLIILIIYIIIQTVAQGVLGDTLPLFIENPLGEVANKIIGPIGFTLLTIGAAVSMFGNVSSKVLSTPRIFFAASLDQVIPIKKLSDIHSKYLTPHISIIVYASLCFLFSIAGGFKELAILSSATSLLIALGISIAVIKLRRKDRYNTDSKSFRIPGGATIPILSSIAILWFLSNLSLNKMIAVGLSIIFLTVVFFAINSKLKKNRRP